MVGRAPPRDRLSSIRSAQVMAGPFDSHMFQWVIMPSDGLVKGKNTFLLCGGSFSMPNGIIMLGFNTLSARLSK